MTNYEKYKEIIDLTFEHRENIALNKDTKEVVSCWKLTCDNCLFSGCRNAPYPCDLNRIRWLVSEYKEPEIDWSKVPIDTPVLVSGDGVNWERRYFVRKPAEAMFGVYSNGATSWSADGYVAWYRYAKLANEN